MNTSAEALTVDDFINKLKELCDGLFYMSESDYPLEPVQFEAPAAAPLTPAVVLTLVGLPSDAPVEVVELPYFFRNMTADMPDADEFMKSIAQRFRDLQAYLLQHLEHVKVYRIGYREIQVFILGFIDEKHLAGVKTVSIET